MHKRRGASCRCYSLQKAGFVLSLLLLLQPQFALADTAEAVQSAMQKDEGGESSSVQDKKPEEDNTPRWKKSLSEGSDHLFYFVEAISGKKLKTETYELLKGVNEVAIEKSRIVFRRSDNQELEISHDTDGGAKFFSDWEKSKINLEDKFGKSGKEFLDNIASVHLKGDRIEVIRNGPEELVVELGNRKIHPAFDLRGLRFRKISLLVDRKSDFPGLEDIQGVTAVIKAPGLSFPVDVKEFSKKKLEKENEIKVGVRNPVPGALRALLFMPQVFRFHFKLKRKEIAGS